MNTNTLILCDRDEMYAGRLYGYIKGAMTIPLDIHEVTDLSHLREELSRLEEEDPGSRSVILPEEMYEDTVFPAGKTTNVLVLTEEGEGRVKEREGVRLTVLNRYRPAREIADRLFTLMTEDENTVVSGVSEGFKGSRVIGFYSPVKRSGQTILALTMGQLMTKTKRALYISFEAFGGAYFGNGENGGNLTDILYYHDCVKDRLPLYVERFKTDMNGLSCIGPAGSMEEVADISPAQFKGLIATLAASGAYDVILLDLTDLVSGLKEILTGCEAVYMTGTHDTQAKEKLRQYMRSLKLTGNDALTEKIRVLTPPITGAVELNDLTESAMAAYLMKGGYL